MKSLVVVFSFHHQNTEKIAKVFAQVLDAPIKTPQEINPDELREYSLIGFGSGIYGGKHHRVLLDLADQIPHVTNKNAFIFSTSGMTGEAKVTKDHSKLRETLQAKGYTIVDEFNCAGWNTNVGGNMALQFLSRVIKLFGGMNKGRPNAEDLQQAEAFAQNLKQNLQISHRIP
jgi:flavodoxin